MSIDIDFEPNWKAVFVRDFCAVCKNRDICPWKWECHDMKEFIENNEEAHEDIHDDDSKNRA